MLNKVYQKLILRNPVSTGWPSFQQNILLPAVLLLYFVPYPLALSLRVNVNLNIPSSLTTGLHRIILYVYVAKDALSVEQATP